MHLVTFAPHAMSASCAGPIIGFLLKSSTFQPFLPISLQSKTHHAVSTRLAQLLRAVY
jgi:hypothetical protein